jgi:outer membrane protein OmpA-like peptidoglycan-associated protein
LASFTRDRLSVALNFGYHIRPQSVVLWDDPDTDDGPVPLLKIDDELTYGLGATYKLHRLVGLGLELYGSLPVTSSDYEVTTTRVEPDPNKCPAGSQPGVPCEIITKKKLEAPQDPVTELLAGVIVSPKPGVDISLGGGAGLTGGERRAAFRLFLGFSWIPGVGATKSVGDKDKDGIPDDRDRCPDKPEDKDGFQDDDGCPDLDRDKDGVPDDRDKCPDEPEDRDDFQDDDGCPDPDNDGDGILDKADKCPNEAEDKDGFQDDDGCPDPDNDGDKIADARDKCPMAPETYNGYEDSDGCPDTAPGAIAIKHGKLEVKEKILFGVGGSKIDRRSYKLLDQIAKRIIGSPAIGQIRIEGHTDATGSARANQRLSQARAEAVRRYLIGKGVPARRLQAVGYGGVRPIAPNKTRAGRAKNRRVEFIVIQQRN